MRHTVLRGLAALAAAALAAAAAAQDISEDVLGRARTAQVVFVGEAHDNPDHHARQAALVRAVTPRALVFEMISAEDAPVVNRMRGEGAGAGDIAAALDWSASGWPDFALYHQVIAAAGDAPVFGAQAARPALSAAVREGAAAAFGAGAARYRLDRALDAAEQAAREARQMEAHCNALPAEMLPGMVAAQRLRDALLAQQVEAALELPGPGPVVVITGNGHADREWGAPSMLPSDVDVFVYGQFEEAATERAEAFDAYAITPAVEREDPCAGLTGSG